MFEGFDKVDRRQSIASWSILAYFPDHFNMRRKEIRFEIYGYSCTCSVAPAAALYLKKYSPTIFHIIW